MARASFSCCSVRVRASRVSPRTERVLRRSSCSSSLVVAVGMVVMFLVSRVWAPLRDWRFPERSRKLPPFSTVLVFL